MTVRRTPARRHGRQRIVGLEHALAWLATLGVHVTAVMTNIAFCYTQRTSATGLVSHEPRQFGTRAVVRKSLRLSSESFCAIRPKVSAPPGWLG